MAGALAPATSLHIGQNGATVKTELLVASVWK
jgi:hypothetical protein